MSHLNNFCKQPLGITGHPEYDVVGPLLSLRELEILCLSLMIHLALKHCCHCGESFWEERWLCLSADQLCIIILLNLLKAGLGSKLHL